MANRIVDHTYILDTASANVALPLGGKFIVNSVAFWSANTGKVILAGDSTADHLVVIQSPDASGSTRSVALGGVSFDTLKVPTLTAGTAWIYMA
jgi:hypothetical protein